MKISLLLIAAFSSYFSFSQNTITKTLSVDTIYFSLDLTDVEALNKLSPYSRNRDSLTAYHASVGRDPLNNGCRSIVKAEGTFKVKADGSETLFMVDTLVYPDPIYSHKFGTSFLNLDRDGIRYFVEPGLYGDTLWSASLDSLEFPSDLNLNSDYYPVYTTLSDIESSLERQGFSLRIDMLCFTTNRLIMPIYSLEWYSEQAIEKQEFTYVTIQAWKGHRRWTYRIVFM